MVYQANVINIMIVSPGDVGDERNLIQDKISIWNSKHSDEYGMILKPLRWEVDSYPGVGKAQSLINDQVVDRSDMAIAIFWSKLGTPTDTHLSGSVEELEAHIKANKPAMVFFSNAAIPNDFDVNQLEKLRTFKKEIQNRCFYAEYNNLSDLSEQLDRHLHNCIRRYFEEYSKLGSMPEQINSPQVEDSISPESFILLERIDNSRTKCMMVGQDMYGFSVSIDGEDLITDNEGRTKAKMKSRIEELENHNLVESIEGLGNTYEITEAGYQLLDRKSQQRLSPEGTEKCEPSTSTPTGLDNYLTDDEIKYLSIAIECGPIRLAEIFNQGLLVGGDVEKLCDTLMHKEVIKLKHVVNKMAEKNLIELLDPKTAISVNGIYPSLYFQATYEGIEAIESLEDF